MNKIIKRVAMFLLLMILPFSAMCTINVHAAEINLHFGSQWYEHGADDSFQIGMYIESDEIVGDYEVVVAYDADYITYLGGADQGGAGLITLAGNLNDVYKKYMVSFQAMAAGDTDIKVVSAVIKDVNGNEINIASIPNAPIHLKQDVKPVLTSIDIEGESLEGFDPEVYSYAINVPYNDEPLDIVATAEDGAEVAVSDTSLEVGDNTITIEVIGSDDTRNTYVIDVHMEEAINVEPPVDIAEEDAPGISDGTDDIGDTDVSIAGDGTSAEQEFIDIGNLEADASEASKGNELTISIMNGRIEIPAMKLFIALLVLLFIIIILYIIFASKRKKNNKSQLKQPEEMESLYEPILADPEDGLEWISIEDDGEIFLDEYVDADEDDYIEEEYAEPENAEPVISIQNVTMKFKISTSDASGLKEFLIQKLKKKVTYRELLALNNVSFDVFKGEVVGIIGTNGSGKSTLLRIVSGALSPSSGRVVVDRRKVQLLTLGTGFDMELTARENVYLNGAIIGYTKKFIDDHFNEIIEFAELGDFVDEKVKNFSSGMVSRLGFAIATVGDAAEILILDEVLSVGDEFFRKKSLARIKEMIHGGSTVLMVSHGMGTILENCTKVAWIEKGVLQTVGDAKTVCSEYQKMGGV